MFYWVDLLMLKSVKGQTPRQNTARIRDRNVKLILNNYDVTKANWFLTIP